MQTKPFLKWAGGKSQLIMDIEKALPKEFISQKFTYIEPFVGSGAVLFWILNNFPNMEKAIINDINSDLTNAYQIIAVKPKEVISILKQFQNEYHALELIEEKKREYFYSKRELFNTRSTDKVTQAALFIFLNRTCFNGLFRVNRNNCFNVPIGSYKKPTICDEENILGVSEALRKVEILTGDYEQTLKYAEKPAFFYFDPPYKPLSKTSSFNSYSKNEFDDSEQIRLGYFCKTLDSLGHFWMLSNSYLKSEKTDDNFFDEIYDNFNINSVYARRMINADPLKRGELKESLITNYIGDFRINNINILP
jgi:DNA adenine methylase